MQTKEAGRIRVAKWRKLNPDKKRLAYAKSNLKRRGITLEQLNEMIVIQSNLCAVCKKPETNGRRLAIDHCHKTGKIRELLCSKCNNSLGLLKEDPMTIIALLEYVIKHASN